MALRLASAAVVIAVLAVPCAPRASADDTAAIHKLLKTIPTASGQSALERMKSCGIRIQSESWTEAATEDIPNLSAKEGDTIIELFVDFPKPPAGAPQAESAAMWHDMLMRWTIHNGKASPTSGWGEDLQKRPIPLGSFSYLNC